MNTFTSKELICGYHSVLTLLKTSPKRILKLYLQKDRLNERERHFLSLARANNIAIYFCSRRELDRLLPNQQHQGFIAECKETKNYEETDLPNLILELTLPPFLLILDRVQDPHNLGACLRSAYAAGVHIVIAPWDAAVGLTSVSRKAACGAAELIPFIQVTNLARTLRWLKSQGIWIYGLAEKASKSIYEARLTGSLGLVLGAEGKGLRRLTQELCDELLIIPTRGKLLSSLNVSVATGICLFEVLRQQLLQKNKF